MEIRDVPGYPGVRVDSEGGVYGRSGKKVVGYVNAYGYRVSTFSFGGKYITVTHHKMIMRAFHGLPPEGHNVDHINRVRSDNRLCNLRYVTFSHNSLNAVNHPGRDLPQGVTRHRKGYMARLSIDRKQTYLGMFDTPEAAHAVILEARAKCGLN